MKDIKVNSLLEYPANAIIERVLWIDPSNRSLYSIDIEAPCALPVFHTMEEIEKLRDAGILRLADKDPWLRPLIGEAIPASHRERRAKQVDLA